MNVRTKLIITGFIALFLGGCSGGESGGVESSTHVHQFASNTSPCQTRVCLTCGEHVVPSVDHDYHKGETVEPTCTDYGYTVEVCSLCGEEVEVDVVSALDHDYQKVGETAASCAKPGVITYECARCHEETHEYTARLDHTFTDAGMVISPTCETGGYTIHTCNVCQEVVYSDFLPALGHVSDGSLDVVIAPTCTEEGYTDHVCAVCHEHFQDTYVDATGHDYKVEKHVEATCEHVSYDVLRCVTCDASSFAATANDKKDHSYDTSGNCTECGDGYLVTEHFSYEKEGNPILALPQEGGYSVVYSPSDVNHSIQVSVSAVETRTLMDKGVKSLTFFLANTDANRRTFGFRLQSNGTFTYANTDESIGFGSAPYFTVRLLNDDGTKASGVTESGLSFEIIHTNYDDGDTAAKKTDSFAIQVMASKLFRPEDPSSYVIDVDGFTSYTEGKGFKTSVSDPETASYRCYLPAKLFAAKIEEGYTSFTLTYDQPWDGVTYKGDATKTNFQHWAYFIDGDGNHVRGVFDQAWIMTGETTGDGCYDFTYPLTTSKWDLSYNDFEMNWSANDQDGFFVGATYWSISFAK